MPPDYCPAHSNLMLLMGEVKGYQEAQCKELKEIKAILALRQEERVQQADTRAESKAKINVLWVILMTLISGVTAFFVKKVCP